MFELAYNFLTLHLGISALLAGSMWCFFCLHELYLLRTGSRMGSHTLMLLTAGLSGFSFTVAILQIGGGHV